jgi:branched-chain amino acid transport system permease protein
VELGLQLFINGVVAGAVYAIAALGFGLIYSSTRIFHIAHGAVFTASAYTLYTAATLLHIHTILAVAATVLVGCVAGLVCDLGVYSPLRRRRAGLAAQLIASLGIFIVAQNLIVLVFGNQGDFIEQGALSSYQLGDLTITKLHLITVAVAILSLIILQMVMTQTRIGKAVRGVANNWERAQAVGISLPLVHVFVFVVGSGLVALAAVLVSFDVGVRPDLGLRIVLVAAVSVIVGGVNSLAGAAYGGLLLGLIENLTIWKIPARWEETIAFAILIAFLVFRPEGLIAYKNRQG